MTTPRKTTVRRAPDDAAVAWKLAAAAHPHLSRVDADRIYIALGIGEVFDAIEALIDVVARDRIPVGGDVATTVASWLDSYRGQDAEPRLRQLLADVELTRPQPMSALED